MKIAAFLPRVPWPLEKGDKLRAYHLLKALSEKHDIYLFALSDQKTDEASRAVLLEFCEKVEIVQISKAGIASGLFTALKKGWPFQAGYFYSKKALKRWYKFVWEHEPHVIFYQLIRSLPYADVINRFPSVIDLQDTFSLSMDRLSQQTSFPTSVIWKREARKVEAFEKKALKETDAQIIISEQDRQHLPVIDASKVKIITNGISLKNITPGHHQKEVDLIFAGNMGYQPNIIASKYLAKEIMPLVWKQKPDTTLALVGINPSSGVKQLANDRIQVTGFVDKITDWYDKSRILVAPMQTGAGLQNKILEAMALELPCVVSEIARKGLPEKAHDLVLTESDPQSFAEAIITLLEDEKYCEMLGRQGRKYVAENHSWQKIGEELGEIIEGVVR